MIKQFHDGATEANRQNCGDGEVARVHSSRSVALGWRIEESAVEEAGRRYGQELGIDLQVGGMLTLDQGRALAGLMADKLFEETLVRHLFARNAFEHYIFDCCFKWCA